MVTSSVRIKLIAFVVLGLIASAYLGAKYAGISLVDSGYTVRVELADAGGLFANGEVTYRGVPVGRIKQLEPTADGVEATLRISSDAPDLPAHPTVTVADRSTIGEQYLDLGGPSASSGKHLADGDRIEAAAATLPPDLSGLLQDTADFAASVPTDDLKTVIDESYDLSHGVSGDLRRLISTSQQFQKQADDNWLVSQALIHDSATVLKTQEESAADIRGYSSDLDVIAKTLKSSDGDLRTLIQNSPDAARQLGELFDQVGRPLGTLMGNLISTAQIFGTNADGLQDTLVRVPEAVSVGYAVSGSQGMDFGMIPTFFDPLPCTQGYGGTAMHSGTDTSSSGSLNLDAGCTAATSSGKDVLGPSAVSSGSGAGKATARVSVPSSLADLLGGAQ
ncbi:MlaD family protein [Nocardioides sp. BP30]|uniref:MlaD family protein n=1 Tax=Nocardioides sp. BP30 TaxID=3036374 RepID=UPI0024685ED6|nr:MlaD family protein [Nocardioides sp. BP30]WGL53046.1 MlaD family protein [Nocardioides sp. BP30]